MPVELLFEFNPTEETGVLVNDITFETLGYGGREIYVETSWYKNNMNNLFCSCESSSLEISQYLQLIITVKCGEVEIPNTEITIYNNGVVAKDINGNDCIGVTNSLGQIEFIFNKLQGDTFIANVTSVPNAYNEDNTDYLVYGDVLIELTEKDLPKYNNGGRNTI